MLSPPQTSGKADFARFSLQGMLSCQSAKPHRSQSLVAAEDGTDTNVTEET